ncbi:LLM class flavin-dependent oxidoreductase [Salipiger sp. HF18]|uniref:LLM class flavin-dependent oxidoreductase n=1 Tax=Salipiger sp. HF18 TaxID=2721557 RepID=UPI00142E7B28|nr:LLM class flavin-dependent oxidoreductase [Salipiger sp. HF18]NIY97219.1 LLM class flavin-dependent oxidoreductase [Salipiger sp. HF18]
MTRMMHLGTIVGAAGHHVAGWRMPDAEFGSQNLELITRIVKTWEDAKFDLIFFADAVNTGLDAHPTHMLRLEPLTLLGALCMTTSKIGLVATVSTTYSQPYNVARMLASIDHMSKGRGGWNVVTGSSPDAAANFGTDPHPEHASRYARAAEHVEICKGLWDTWEDDAYIADKATGRYVDGDKMHVLNYRGAHLSSSGPLNITRPPQGYPVIMQAGASPTGKTFAAASAEVVFATQQLVDDAVAFAEDLKDRTEAAGRPRDAIRLMLGVSPVIGRTREEAQEKLAELAALVDPVAALRVLSDRIGTDLSAYDLDGPVPDLPPSGMMQGHAVVLQAVAKKHNMTIRQLRDYAAVSSGHRLVFGTAEDIADDLEAWWRAGACDGFIILPPYYMRPQEEFCEQVVPILQERGLFRTEYEGSTLREHLGLERPAHPAAQARSEAMV